MKKENLKFKAQYYNCKIDFGERNNIKRIINVPIMPDAKNTCLVNGLDVFYFLLRDAKWNGVKNLEFKISTIVNNVDNLKFMKQFMRLMNDSGLAYDATYEYPAENYVLWQAFLYKLKRLDKNLGNKINFMPLQYFVCLLDELKDTREIVKYSLEEYNDIKTIYKNITLELPGDNGSNKVICVNLSQNYLREMMKILWNHDITWAQHHDFESLLESLYYAKIISNRIDNHDEKSKRVSLLF